MNHPESTDRPPIDDGALTLTDRDAERNTDKSSLPESAEATYRLPAPVDPLPSDPSPEPLLKTARDVFNLPQPAPVLWRDPDPGTGDYSGNVDAVLSVGEVAILASAGGLGKSCLTLALAVEAATAAEKGREYGAACGLRVKAGAVVAVSYEDSPARIGDRLRWFASTPPERFYLWANPAPLFETSAENRGAVVQCADWDRLWEEIEATRPALVIVDPVSAALADADTSQTGPARTFLRKVSEKAAAAACGVLLVAHDTKSARNLAMAGLDPGAGAVAGSAAWYDGARGVLTLMPDPTEWGARLLVAIKANYGRTGWGADLRERFKAGKFRGLELQARMDAAEVNQWRAALEAQAKRESREAKEGPRGKAKRAHLREEATDV